MKVLTAIASSCLLFGQQSTVNAAAGDDLYARRGQLVSAEGTLMKAPL